MIRGFYTASSGMITQEKKLNAYANNIANANTIGYKKDDLVSGTFGEHIAVRLNSYSRQSTQVDLGPSVYMQTVVDKYVNHNQGSFKDTFRTFDLAVQGDGYFVVQDAEGNDLLTRNGQFGLDDEGYLVLPGVGRVQGEGGDIAIETAAFGVDRNGVMYTYPEEDGEEPNEFDRLLVVIPTDFAAMEKTANGLFASEGYTQMEDNGDTLVRQGTLEASNVDLSEEMTRIIASQRGLQSASQLVRMYDEMNTKANDTLAKLR